MSRNSCQIHNEIHCNKHDNVVRKTITYCNTYFCQYVINKDSVEYYLPEQKKDVSKPTHF